MTRPDSCHPAPVIRWTVSTDHGVVATGDRARAMAMRLVPGIDPLQHNPLRADRVWHVDDRIIRAEVLR